MSRPHRIEGFDYLGPYRYFLTFCTLNRSMAFVQDETARNTLLQIQRTAREERFADFAHCLMPDHAHLIVEGTSPQSDLRRFVTMAKRRSGAMHALLTGRRLWQEGFYDRVLREDDDVRALCRYILDENPVRAGLVARPEEWPRSGSEAWTMEELMTVYE